MNTPITTSTVVSRSRDTAFRKLDGQMLVITTHDSILHRLNPVATFIWEFIESPRSTREITDAVADSFEGFDAGLNGKEINSFITMLKDKKLIRIDSSHE